MGVFVDFRNALFMAGSIQTTTKLKSSSLPGGTLFIDFNLVDYPYGELGKNNLVGFGIKQQRAKAEGSARQLHRPVWVR